MNRWIIAACLGALAASASAIEMARPTHGGIPVAAPKGAAAPARPDAPNQGSITRLDLKGGLISIAGHDMAISQPLVAILDRRANATGTNKLADLRVGMQVRYREQGSLGGLPRLVELWLLSDTPKEPAKRKP